MDLRRDHGNEGLRPEEKRARDAVRALSSPRAPEPFRSALGEAFAAGRVGVEGEPGVHSSAATPAASPRGPFLPGGQGQRSMRSSFGGSSPRARRAAWAASLAFLTAVLAVLTLALWPSGPKGEAGMWAIVDVEGVGAVWTEGVSARDAESLRGERVASGTRLRTDSGVRLELASVEDLCSFAIEPGTDFTVPQDDGQGVLVARLDAGFVLGMTGGAFPGHELRIEAPEASVRVRGTTFSVLADDEKTCISVLEGEVGVHCPESGGLHVVPAGRCRQVYRAGTQEDLERDLNEGQREGLARWEKRCRKASRRG